MNGLKKAALILTIIGGINWLIYGLMDRDLVGMILPASIAKIIYILVGIAAIIALTYLAGRGAGWKKVALLLSIIGGINWLLVGLADFDLVAYLFGVLTMPSRIVYILVGLASIAALSLLGREDGRDDDIVVNKRS